MPATVLDSALSTSALGAHASNPPAFPGSVSTPSALLWISGDPTGTLVAPQGTLAVRVDGGLPNTLYLKTSGGVATPDASGWVPMGAVATGRLTGQIAAVPTVVTFTPTVDQSFDIEANVLITASTTFNFTVNVAYTDEGNTPRTHNILFNQPASTTTASIANAAGAVPYAGYVLRIRAKAGTPITVSTSGVFTTVVYNVEASIMPRS